MKKKQIIILIIELILSLLVVSYFLFINEKTKLIKKTPELPMVTIENEDASELKEGFTSFSDIVNEIATSTTVDKSELDEYPRLVYLDLSLYKNDNILGINYVASTEDVIDIVLVNSNQEGFKYRVKENNGELKDIDISTLPKGVYYVYYNFNNEKYNSNKFITKE